MSGSKVIPLLTMLLHALEEEELGLLQTLESRELTEGLRRQVKEKLFIYQSKSITSVATILDPCFKKLGFFSPNKADEAEKRLISECAAVIRSSTFCAPSSSSSEGFWIFFIV